MKRVLDFSSGHLLLGIYCLLGMSITAILAINTIALSSFSLDPYVRIIVTVWTVSMIPIAIYIPVFTKFNNPFRKRESHSFSRGNAQ